MAIMISGVGSQAFQFEFVTFYEYSSLGIQTVPSTTTSHSDLVGLSALRNFMGTLSQYSPGVELYKKAVYAMYQTLAPSAANMMVRSAPLLLGL
jgi:hypothetical protein